MHAWQPVLTVSVTWSRWGVQHAVVYETNVMMTAWGGDTAAQRRRTQHASAAGVVCFVANHVISLTYFLWLSLSPLCPPFSPSLHPCGADEAAVFTLGWVNPWPSWPAAAMWILQSCTHIHLCWLCTCVGDVCVSVFWMFRQGNHVTAAVFIGAADCPVCFLSQRWSLFVTTALFKIQLSLFHQAVIT